MPCLSELDFQQIETDSLRAIETRLEPWSLMDETERYFVNGLLRHFKPKKVLEVGVFAGAGSALLLNALGDRPEAHLYSVDVLYHLLKMHGYSKINGNRDIGFVVEEAFPELAGQWTLYRGRRAEEVLEDIGPGIDCVVLDTAHFLPGEILDFLLILPYTTDDCLFILHDINMTVTTVLERGEVRPEYVEFPPSCRLLMNAVDALKIYPRRLPPSPFADNATSFLLRHLENSSLPNIGAFVPTSRTREPEALEAVFNSLLLRWALPFQLSYRNVIDISARLRQHYPERLAAIFDQAYAYNFYLKNAGSIKASETS